MSDPKTEARPDQAEVSCGTDLPPLDHTTREWRDNLEEKIELYRSKCPFGFSTAHGGFWYAMEPDVVRTLMNDPSRLVSSRGLVVPKTPVPDTMIPINQDPPDLYEWRSILNAHFSPKLMAAEAPAIRQDAYDLFDAALATGKVDMVNDIAQPLTGKTVLRLIGLDPKDWPAYAHPFHDLTFGRTDMEGVGEGMREMEARLRRDIEARVGTPRASGFLKYLSEEARFQGRPLTLDEMWNIMLILLGGGLDTTQALLGSATVYLGRHPERQRELIDHPERMAYAIEEFLRSFPPTQHIAREAIEDVEVEGQVIKADTKVMCSIMAANHDPKEFPNPYELDFTREVNRHFAFGMGPHRCLGSHLARIMIAACLEALLDRVPGFGVAADVDQYMPADLNFFYGYERVELVLP